MTLSILHSRSITLTALWRKGNSDAVNPLLITQYKMDEQYSERVKMIESVLYTSLPLRLPYSHGHGNK